MAAWEEALEVLRSTEAPRYLSASPELSRVARAASAGLYASLRPYCPPASAPLDRLLADEAFDAEQIWQQIDLLARPLLSSLRRHLTRLPRDVPPLRIRTEGKEGPAASGAPLPEEIMGTVPHVDGEKERGGEDSGKAEEEEDEDEDDEEEDEDDEEENKDEDEGDRVEGNAGVVEDRFLKIKELEEYLERDEAKEYGLSLAQHKNSNKKIAAIDKEEEEEDVDDVENEGEKEDNDDDEDEQDGGFSFGDVDHDSDEDADPAENAMYEDFFGSKKQKRNKQSYTHEKTKGSLERTSLDGSKYLEMDEEERDDEHADMQDNEFLSTHEKELQKLQSKIKQMEKVNMEPKSWTMQGEVTAAKRPKNSALEVDLDFEHNVRPPPVITEEITASLEDLIKKRISEGHFDDVQRAPALPSKAPKPQKELDESKSQKGLAEIYEEEYAQKTGLVSAPLSASDEKKEEASTLFKKLCLKLDALSHFHFAPKPVIEDMSIQSNVPALAMEEIAPLAVSDAAMLAPEEIFEGKGDIKEEAELTQAERKRRRANKKRKFKAETAKRAAKKAWANASLKRLNGQEES